AAVDAGGADAVLVERDGADEPLSALSRRRHARMISQARGFASPACSGADGSSRFGSNLWSTVRMTSVSPVPTTTIAHSPLAATMPTAAVTHRAAAEVSPLTRSRPC